MSLSIIAFGIKAPTKQWELMRDVWSSCKEAGVSIPKEVSDYFDNEPPHHTGPMVRLGFTKEALENGTDYRLELSTIPKGIELICFRLTWPHTDTDTQPKDEADE